MMKYMILLYGSQQDYDSMAGKPAPGRPSWTGSDFAAMGAFMEAFSKDLADSGEQAAAGAAYLTAASRTSNLPQQRYLNARAARCRGRGGGSDC